MRVPEPARERSQRLDGLFCIGIVVLEKLAQLCEQCRNLAHHNLFGAITVYLEAQRGEPCCLAELDLVHVGLGNLGTHGSARCATW